MKFNKDGEYVMQVGGKKGKADGEFDTAHDVALDARGRVYVADRENHRVQIFLARRQAHRQVDQRRFALGFGV